MFCKYCLTKIRLHPDVVLTNIILRKLMILYKKRIILKFTKLLILKAENLPPFLDKIITYNKKLVTMIKVRSTIKKLL